MAAPEASTSSPPPDGDRSRGFQIIAVHAILLGISTILSVLRLFTRSVIVKSIGLDDYLMVVGVVSNSLCTISRSVPMRLIYVALVCRWIDSRCFYGPKWDWSSHILPLTEPTNLGATV